MRPRWRREFTRYLVFGLILLAAIAVGVTIVLLRGEEAPPAPPPEHQPLELSDREIYLSPKEAARSRVAVSEVRRIAIVAQVRLIGEVDYDETTVMRITAWVPGRIEELFVDYTGQTVVKGEPMLELYSPELIAAQEELISAVETLEKLQDSPSQIVKRSMAATVQGAREKLRLWGLSREQVSEIEQQKEPEEFLTILSPMAGTVVEKNAFEGMYVDEGTLLYAIADLSMVWIHLEGYESDFAWLQVGQRVRFTVQAIPGRVFQGVVTFIDPFLNPETRTAEVRVEAPNPDMLLKPGMFANATIESPVGSVGELEEIMGYSCVDDDPNEPPLVIPTSAPLITGKRAVVYVADPDREGVYEGREIVLGPRIGDYYVVCEGLAEGEVVVTNGNFRIDSEIQIRAKKSMMNPEGSKGIPDYLRQ